QALRRGPRPPVRPGGGRARGGGPPLQRLRTRRHEPAPRPGGGAAAARRRARAPPRQPRSRPRLRPRARRGRGAPGPRGRGRGGGEAYNVGSARGYSVREVVAAFAEVLARPLAIDQDPERVRPVERLELVSDTRKIRTRIGWAPRVGFVDGVRELVGGLSP